MLQPRDLPKDGKAIPFVSDFFDFSIYLDAEEEAIRGWYIERFMRLKETRFRDPALLFPRLCRALATARRRAIAVGLWERINLVNLRENILPTRPRADLILTKRRRPRGEGSRAEEALGPCAPSFSPATRATG